MEDETRWLKLSNAETIKRIRKFFGMPEAKPGMKACKKCEVMFQTIFVSKRSPQWFCPKCKAEMYLKEHT